MLLGTSLTSYSISLITSIAQGGGFNVSEEGYEEWKDSMSSIKGESSSRRSVRIARPLRDIGMKECAAWAWWAGLNVAGKEKHPGINPRQTIAGLTRSAESFLQVFALITDMCYVDRLYSRLRE